MAKNRTRDGMEISRIIRAAMEAGATIRDGKKHASVLNYAGSRPCPIASSTSARHMVAPWLAEIKGCTNKEAYQAIQTGYWHTQ